MASQLEQETVFTALTRPQMFASVTYSWFVGNAIVCAELFLIFKSFWALLAGLILHLVGVVLALREPRFLDLWIARVSKCPRIKNYRLWGCNSYRP